MKTIKICLALSHYGEAPLRRRCSTPFHREPIMWIPLIPPNDHALNNALSFRTSSQQFTCQLRPINGISLQKRFPAAHVRPNLKPVKYYQGQRHYKEVNWFKLVLPSNLMPQIRCCLYCARALFLTLRSYLICCWPECSPFWPICYW